MPATTDHVGLVVICIALVGIVYVWSVRSARSRRSVKPRLATDRIKEEDTTLPKDFPSWVYLYYSPDLNFSESDRGVAESFPNVYVSPAGYAEFLRSGVLPEGTIAFRQFELEKPPNTSALAGRACRICFSPDRARTADVRIKDTTRFSDTNGWGYFQFDLSHAHNPL